MRKDGKKIPDASKGDGEAPPNELRTVSRRALITGAAATAGSVMTVGAARGLGIEQSSLDPTPVPGERPEEDGSR
mgnify:CR=1 FL=1